MRAALATINHCAVPFFKPRRHQLVLVVVYVLRLTVSGNRFHFPRDNNKPVT